MHMSMKRRTPPPDNGLGQPVKRYEDTFSAADLLLREMATNSPMKCEIVETDEAFADAVARHKAGGRRLAAVSNAGLKPPARRLTFLPDSAFTDK
jgi:hypothetical protein